MKTCCRTFIVKMKRERNALFFNGHRDVFPSSSHSILLPLTVAAAKLTDTREDLGLPDRHHIRVFGDIVANEWFFFLFFKYNPFLFRWNTGFGKYVSRDASRIFSKSSPFCKVLFSLCILFMKYFCCFVSLVFL